MEKFPPDARPNEVRTTTNDPPKRRPTSGRRERFRIDRLSGRTWPDFERVAEKHHGVWGGCWCVSFHLPPRGAPRTFAPNEAATPDHRRKLKERLVRANRSHASLVYSGADVVGWCQFGPPSELPARMGGPAKLGLASPDWRITCFFVDRNHRKEGVARAALAGALRMIASRGGGTVDAYPSETRGKPTAGSFLWGGTVSMFETAGFRTIAALGTSKVVMRKSVKSRTESPMGNGGRRRP
ncbi:MAG: GNAT family N-acetyltransferase [Candidatus Lutacidiplasmatales archaeon]